jgi:hypothetical protein
VIKQAPLLGNMAENPFDRGARLFAWTISAALRRLSMLNSRL